MRKLVFIEKDYRQLKKIHFSLLSYMVCWVASEKKPRTVKIDNRTGYWFSLKRMADENNLSYQQVQRALFRLEGKDDKFYIPPLLKATMVHSHTEFSRLYFVFDFIRIFNMLEKTENNQRIINKIKERNMIEPLFQIEGSDPINPNADAIVRKILSENSDIFKTRCNRTKTYRTCCNIMTDIYNGTYLNPRVYDLHNVASVRWFEVSDYKHTLRTVRNDWEKVESLILQAVSNYRLMFDQRYMPQNKEYLPRSFEKWLYDVSNENYPSYFVLSFNPPNLTARQYGEIKADRIFDSLPRQLQVAGNELHDILPKGSYQVVLWENIQKMWEWAKMVLKKDSNAIYWFNSSVEIVDKFIEYCRTNNIVISPSTLNIEKAVASNAPFVWFVQDAIKKYGLNANLCNCATENDFEKFYKA